MKRTVTDENFEYNSFDGQGIVSVTAKLPRVVDKFEWQIKGERNVNFKCADGKIKQTDKQIST
jgi:hypothetical protein